MQTSMVFSSFRKQKIAEKATDYNEAYKWYFCPKPHISCSEKFHDFFGIS